MRTTRIYPWRRLGLMGRVFARSIALMLCASMTHAAQEGAAELLKTPILWKGVEVITNDFDSVERIRELAALHPDTLLLMSDPKLRAVCDAVRRELASSKVVCSNVLSGTPGGPPNAWYLIEVDIQAREPLTCRSGGELSEDLSQLVDAWQQALATAMLEGAAAADRVNDRKYLDYANPELSSMAGRLHATTVGRVSELEAAAGSCDARQRANSFYLMTFVGDPRRFVQLAGSHINDPDAGAANAATRFLMVFADFAAPQDVHRFATEACRSLREGGFAARNKSLSVLNAWRKNGSLSFAQLGTECQRQVRDIARTSIAEHIALPARELAGEAGAN